jgi:hypothetical protein
MKSWQRAVRVWEWLASLAWPDDLFDERESILGEFAFVLASGYRQVKSYRAYATLGGEMCRSFGRQ